MGGDLSHLRHSSLGDRGTRRARGLGEIIALFWSAGRFCVGQVAGLPGVLLWGTSNSTRSFLHFT